MATIWLKPIPLRTKDPNATVLIVDHPYQPNRQPTITLVEPGKKARVFVDTSWVKPQAREAI